MQLTEHQSNIANSVINALKTENVVVLNGSAGTGKTTVLKYIAEQLDAKGKVDCTATTNEASGVLSSKVGKRFPTRTIHSLLKLAIKTDYSTNETKLVRFSPSVPHAGIRIVDEASMVDKALMKFIDEDLQYGGSKYLFVGDSKQLPPVGEKISQVFSRSYPTFTLEEIHRQAHTNDNIRLSQDLSLLYRRESGDYFKWISEDKVLDAMDYGATVIAWRNATVDKYNALYRNHKGRTLPYEVGEKIIISSSGRTSDTYVGQRMDIISIADKKYYYGKDAYIDCFNINKKILVPREASLKTAAIKQLRDSKQYAKIDELKSKVLNVKHGYAMTVHKAQGSTLDHVLVHFTDMVDNPDIDERKKLMYTAVTRTSGYNFII